jgi:tRNA threonylcarbamoyladenosine biosynthesis protein TsaE
MLLMNFTQPPAPQTLPLSYRYQLALPDEAATQQLGKALAAYIKPAFNLHLQGDLGAGKTTLTRALLRALGVTGTLRSPSYALLEPYEVACLEACNPHQGATLHHFDFYRLEGNPHAWKEAGFASAFESPHAAIVEWPHYAAGLPPFTVSVVLAYADANQPERGRIAHIESQVDLQGLQRV